MDIFAEYERREYDVVERPKTFGVCGCVIKLFRDSKLPFLLKNSVLIYDRKGVRITYASNPSFVWDTYYSLMNSD